MNIKICKHLLDFLSFGSIISNLLRTHDHFLIKIFVLPHHSPSLLVCLLLLMLEFTLHKYIYIFNLQTLKLITFSVISKENFKSNLGETVKKGDTN